MRKYYGMLEFSFSYEETAILLKCGQYDHTTIQPYDPVQSLIYIQGVSKKLFDV